MADKLDGQASLASAVQHSGLSKLTYMSLCSYLAFHSVPLRVMNTDTVDATRSLTFIRCKCGANEGV